MRLFSAPGEGRESVEIARRILDEARAGVPFDEMAVFVRSPRDYVVRVLLPSAGGYAAKLAVTTTSLSRMAIDSTVPLNAPATGS